MQKITQTIKYTAALLMLCSTGLQAQKVKEYYPDGKLSFKGSYTYVWGEMESYEYPEVIQGRSSRWSNRFAELDQYSNLIPRKQYDGKCTFYYINGNVYYTGTYEHGVKQGTFTFYHMNGKIAAKRNYEHGMANGTWESWDEQGRMTTQFHYTAFSPQVMKEISNYVFEEVADRDHSSNRKYMDSVFSSIYQQDWKDQLDPRTEAERDGIHVIRKYAEQNLFKRSIKDGSFKVWKEGQPYMEFYFKQNKPAGNWKVWEDGQLVCNMNLDIPRPPRPVQRVPQVISLSEMGGSGDPDAIDPGITVAPAPVEGVPQAEKVFTSVEQMPEFPGGQAAMMTYLSNHIIYPAEAAKNGISGNVILKFVVTEKGDIEDVQVVRKVNPLLDKEAIRVVKSMPKWKPGKQNGRTVRTFYNLPVKFMLQ
ncbi:Gram-negative bacterial tonB protein [compost metagenome]